MSQKMKAFFGKKDSNIGEVSRTLEHLRVRNENPEKEPTRETGSETRIENRRRTRWDLSPEEAILLQKEVYKKESADQEALKSLLKAIERLVQNPETKVKETDSSERGEEVADLFE